MLVLAQGEIGRGLLGQFGERVLKIAAQRRRAARGHLDIRFLAAGLGQPVQVHHHREDVLELCGAEHARGRTRRPRGCPLRRRSPPPGPGARECAAASVSAAALRSSSPFSGDRSACANSLPAGSRTAIFKPRPGAGSTASTALRPSGGWSSMERKLRAQTEITSESARRFISWRSSWSRAGASRRS